VRYEWFIAKRLYSQEDGGRKASRSATTIATLGVALGLAVMIVAVSVVLGFKNEVQNKVTGIGRHIQILNYESLYSPETRPIAVSDSLMSTLERQMSEASKGEAHMQRFCQKSGMLKTDESFQGVLFQGVDEDYDLTFLRSNLSEGSIEKPFSKSENTGRLVISQKLAEQLRLKVGDRVYAYFFDETLRARRFTVEALFVTNMAEYDQRLVFCDMKTCQQLLGFADDQWSGAEVCLASLDQLDAAQMSCLQVLSTLRQDAYGAYYAARTIKEKYPHIFAWLDLLDLNVLVILILMMAVAGFTTIAGLLIIILERTQFIGVMKALGSTNRSLRRLFIYYSMQIILRGLLLGNAIGIGLCLLQQQFGLVHLDAATYYVSEAPILISWPMVLLINIITFVIATLALILPSFVVSNIHPARSIRFE